MLRIRLYLSSDGQHDTSMAAAVPFMRTSASHSSLRPVTAELLSRRDRVRSSTAAVALRIELEQQAHARMSSVETRLQIEENASNESVSNVEVEADVEVEVEVEVGVVSSVQRAAASDGSVSARAAMSEQGG